MDSPLHQNSVDVAIIGAGFSGTMAVIHLLRQTDDRITVGLVERTAQFGRGLAYKTRDATHRLNVPAAKMGAFSEDIGGFYHWLQSRPERLRAVGIHTLHPMLLCRECFSENTSRTCWRRQKPLRRACKKLLTKQSTWCRCLMARFASNSPPLRPSLPTRWFSRLVIFHRAIHRSRTARFTKAIATWLILGPTKLAANCRSPEMYWY